MSILPGTTRYDGMMPIYGLENDYRIRLFLDALFNDFTNNGTTKNFRLKPDMIQLQNRYFEKKDSGKSDDDIHHEWEDFKVDILESMRKLELQPIGNNKLKLEAVQTIRELSGNSDPSSLKRFLQYLIKDHITIIDVNGADITDQSFVWTNAMDFTVNTPNVRNTFAIVNPGNLNTGVKNFTYMFNKFALHRILEISASPRSFNQDTFWDHNEDNTYYRMASNRDLLFTTDSSGNRIEVGKESDELKKVVTTEKCVGTKVKDTASLSCTDYFTKCIKGSQNDIEACKVFLQESDFWDVVPTEVNKMLPPIAEATLNSFGFEIITNNDLLQYESVGSWSHKLDNTPLNSTEKANIRKNTKLMQYLEILVNKINSNPSILNKQYDTRYKFDADDYNNRFSSWTLSARGISPRVMLKKNPTQPINIIRHIGLINNSLLTMRSNINNRLSINPLGGIIINGFPISSLNYPVVFSQYGGAAIQMIPAVSNDSDIKEHYPLIQNLFNSVEKMLQNKGKNFDPYTKKQIEDHLISYKNNEAKLIKAIRYADKYIDLLDIYKEYDSQNVLSMDHIKSFVSARENYFDKTINKQTTILDVIERLANTINDTLDNK